MVKNHHIETLRWEAVFSHAPLALAQQERLSQFIHQHALPCLSRRFDAISASDEVWVLDRLEIDLGRLNARDSAQQWLLQLDAAVQRSLAGLTAPLSKPPTLHLKQTAAAAAPVASGKRYSAATHEMGQFLHYLQHGVLPWGLPLRSARDLAGWLERLARQHGQRLWQALQQLMPPEPVLARLALIAPHAGLQALLGVRHHDLADGMLLLDEAWLLPLQMRGRLSAYQVQRLQQQLRVAGLHTLWGLSGGALGGSRQRRLLTALRAAHAELMGPGWTSLRLALQGQTLPRQPGSELAAAMLQALLGGDVDSANERNAGNTQTSADPVEDTTLRTTYDALRGLQDHVQAWADGRRPNASASQIATWLAQLLQNAPAALAESLRAQMRRRSGRRAWSLALPVHYYWPLLGLLAGHKDQSQETRQVASPRPAPPQWADSLRQTALQLIQQCPAGARPGLSEMQALLMEVSLAYLLDHGRLPATHSAWQALWRGAWQVKGGTGLDQPGSAGAQGIAPVTPGSQAPGSRPDALGLSWLPALIARWQPPPGSVSSSVANENSEEALAQAATPAWPAAALRRWLWEQAEVCLQQHPDRPGPTALQSHWQRAWYTLQGGISDAVSHAMHVSQSGSLKPSRAALWQLHALWLQCERDAWGTNQRLALARLLEEPETCALWCERFDEGCRWRWLHAQFGSVSQALRRCATDLLQQLLQSETGSSDGTPPVPATTTPAPTVATLERHWALLCEHLFVLAGPATPAAMRRHYMAALQGTGPSLARPPVARASPIRRPRQFALPPGTSATSPTSHADGKVGGAAPIWVEDAGQVLLSAYAERLFKHLGLVEAGHFIHKQAQARAVLCLQALVRGQAPHSEPQWPLSKLLCGVEPWDLLPACEPITAAEHKLLGELLGAVITHWKAIGNTSVAGLRESFLQREGRLEGQRSDHGEPMAWRLRVQPRAFDMLLDRLPWGFSTIKHPWMRGLLHVEWR